MAPAEPLDAAPATERSNISRTRSHAMLHRHAHDDIPGVEWWSVPRASPDGEIRIEMVRPASAEEHGAVHRSPAARAEWERMRLDNPRLHDGPILSVFAFEAGRALVRCRVETYMNLAVGGVVDTGVRHLGVNGMVVARDSGGREHVLVARRGAHTRVYQGMWELAPAGGVELPPRTPPSVTSPPSAHSAAAPLPLPAVHPSAPGRAPAPSQGDLSLSHASAFQPEVLTHEELFRQLVREGVEELAVDLAQACDGPARIIGVTRDGVARSDCVVMLVPLAGPIDPRKPLACARDADAWEYIDTAWIARADAAAFAAEAGAVIGPSRAILRWWGAVA